MNPAQIASVLQSVPLFHGLDAPSLDEVARLTRHRTYPAGSALFHAGDSGHTLYIVLTGRVHIEKTSAAGAAIHLAYRGPGDHFGELSLLDGSPRMASACAVTDCECLTVEDEAFQRCLLTSPSVALQVMIFLAKCLRDTADDLECLLGLDVLGRLCKALLEVCPTGGSLQITHQELADRIGATRESVTRALGSLKKTGLLRVSGRTLILLDPAGLRRRCSL